MTRDEAQALVQTMLIPAYDWRMAEDQRAVWARSLERYAPAEGARALQHMIDHYEGRGLPKPGDLTAAHRSVISQPEYMGGERVSSHKPWYATEEARTALLRQEWLIAIPDTAYDDYLQHMRAAQERRDSSEQAQAKAALYRARREMIAVCSEAWEAARQAGMVTTAECQAAQDELGQGGIWPQRVRELAGVLRERQARKGAA